MPNVPEAFWMEEELIGNPNDAQRLLTTEIDRLEKENAELKAALAQAKVERDTMRDQKILTDNTNAVLVSQWGKQKEQK